MSLRIWKEGQGPRSFDGRFPTTTRDQTSKNGEEMHLSIKGSADTRLDGLKLTQYLWLPRYVCIGTVGTWTSCWNHPVGQLLFQRNRGCIDSSLTLLAQRILHLHQGQAIYLMNEDSP